MKRCSKHMRRYSLLGIDHIPECRPIFHRIHLWSLALKVEFVFENIAAEFSKIQFNIILREKVFPATIVQTMGTIYLHISK